MTKDYYCDGKVPIYGTSGDPVPGVRGNPPHGKHGYGSLLSTRPPASAPSECGECRMPVKAIEAEISPSASAATPSDTPETPPAKLPNGATAGNQASFSPVLWKWILSAIISL